MELILTTKEDLRVLIAEAVQGEMAKLKELIPQPVQKEEEELLTREEAAKLLRICLLTLGVWTKAGTVTGYRKANRVYYKKSELMASLKKVEAVNS